MSKADFFEIFKNKNKIIVYNIWLRLYNRIRIRKGDSFNY